MICMRTQVNLLCSNCDTICGKLACLLIYPPVTKVVMSETPVTEVVMSETPVTEVVMSETAVAEVVMSKIHQSLLQRNSDVLVQNMDPYELTTLLYFKSILTDENVANIMAEPTLHKMNDLLLGILVKKPDSAFTIFVKGFVETGQPHLAHKLGWTEGEGISI